MSTGSDPGGQPSEEELRAAYEAQIKKVRIEHVLLEHVVTVANLGLRRTGLAPGTEDERDPEQVQLAIESMRTLLPLLERSMPEQASQLRDALSQLQFAFVKIGGTEPTPAGGEAPGSGEAPGGGGEQATAGGGEQVPRQQKSEPSPPTSQPEQPAPEGPGPAQRSGKLWVPGQ